jgi:hypothetical protein
VGPDGVRTKAVPRRSKEEIHFVLRLSLIDRLTTKQILKPQPTLQSLPCPPLNPSQSRPQFHPQITAPFSTTTIHSTTTMTTAQTLHPSVPYPFHRQPAPRAVPISVQLWTTSLGSISRPHFGIRTHILNAPRTLTLTLTTGTAVCSSLIKGRRPRVLLLPRQYMATIIQIMTCRRTWICLHTHRRNLIGTIETVNRSPPSRRARRGKRVQSRC